MKKIIGIALALVLILGVTAFAEPANPAPDAPAATEEGSDTGVPEKAEDDRAAMKDALDAYRNAKQEKALNELEEELNGYVEAGTMTQDQANLILNSVKERLAAMNGECPNCGYQFQKNGPRMGGMMNLQGGYQQRGQMNNQQHGQMRGCQQRGGMQMPDAQSGVTPRQSGNHTHSQQCSQMQQPNSQMPQVPQR